MGDLVTMPPASGLRRDEPRVSRRRITRALHKELDEICLEAGISFNEVIAKKVVTMAAEGDLDAIKFIADRVEGRATQSIEMSGPGGMPLEKITSETNALDASRAYQQMLGADHDAYVDAGIIEADNVIDMTARRQERDE